VTPAPGIRRHLNEPARLKCCEIVCNGSLLRLVHANPRRVESVDRPDSDSSDNDGIDRTPIERCKWLTGTVGVVLIGIVKYLCRIGRGVMNDEVRRGAEVPERMTLKPDMFCRRNADLHGVPFQCHRL
jgi:hypothetical protein